MSTVHCLNAQVTMVSNRNGNATPDWHLHMYYQQGGRFYVKERHYRDRVHWSIGGERVAQNKLRLWKKNERETRLKGRQQRRKNSKRKRKGRIKGEAGRGRKKDCKI